MAPNLCAQCCWQKGNYQLYLLLVDDTDVIHFDMEKNETALETHVNLQEGVASWGNLLMASGGALKPVKCFYYLISFEWNAQG